MKRDCFYCQDDIEDEFHFVMGRVKGYFHNVSKAFLAQLMSYKLKLRYYSRLLFGVCLSVCLSVCPSVNIAPANLNYDR